MHGLATAQRQYDRQTPENYFRADELVFNEQPAPFTDAAVEVFIAEFAKVAPGEARDFLTNEGIDDTCVGGAEVLRRLAAAWMLNPESVYAVAGPAFWQEMKFLANEAFDEVTA